jgi:signal transduction histidine kinase
MLSKCIERRLASEPPLDLKESSVFKDKRILIIDDSVAICNYLHSVLTRQGASVDVANSGQAGLEAYSGDGAYDLVLLDLILPDLNGIEVLQHIRQEDHETAVVILTGVGGVKSAIAAVQYGADAYVEKQDISAGGDLAAFLYILAQAMEHRAGLVAHKQLQEIKIDFYSMVTHDLRNPASFILTSAESLATGEFGPLTSDQARFLDIIRRSAGKMLSLINDYLDFAKIDAGYLRLNLGDVELREIVESSVQMAQLQAQSKSQTIILDLPAEPVLAHADAERFAQVVDNLLSNAIKYTPNAGRITVQLRVEGEAGSERAVLFVSDTGIGISPAQLPALFTKYHRIPGQASLGIHGTGLGLLIVKEIVEGHEGTVRAESEGVRGKGTTFTVSIPLRPSAG